MRFSFIPAAMFLFLSQILFGNDEIPYFQVDMEGAAGAVITREISHWIFSLPADRRPESFAVGIENKEKSKNSRTVFRIGKDLPASAQPFAAAGTVFAVSKKSPVGSLTLQQAESILAGELTHWKDGDALTPVTICVFTSDPEDAATGEPIRKNKQHRLCFSDENLLVRYVSDSPDCLAILPLIFFRDKTLKLLPVDHVMPSMKNVMNGTYPLASIYRFEADKSYPPAVAAAENLISRTTAVKLMESGAVPLAAAREKKESTP